MASNLGPATSDGAGGHRSPLRRQEGSIPLCPGNVSNGRDTAK